MNRPANERRLPILWPVGQDTGKIEQPVAEEHQKLDCFNISVKKRGERAKFREKQLAGANSLGRCNEATSELCYGRFGILDNPEWEAPK